jgi:hypothetical protein
MKILHPDCPYCTCGQIQLTWSDRDAYVFPEDFEGIADAVVDCALDHSYDRSPTGVPYGLSCDVRDKLAPIVEKHLSAVEADWRENTVHMMNEQRQAFHKDVLAALNT